VGTHGDDLGLGFLKERFLRPIEPVRSLAFRGYTSAVLAVRRLSNSPRLIPSFVIIGAQKGGTASLFNYLMLHPLVARPLRKEVHFFDLNYQRGWDWYRAFFPRAPSNGHIVTGEASPYYLFHPHVPARVAAALADARFIVLLRDPVERAWSHYLHNRRGGREGRDFGTAVAEEASRLPVEEARLAEDEHAVSWFHRHCSYVARGRYLEQLLRWTRYVARDRILVLASEHLFAQPADSYARVLEFLKLPAHRLSAFPAFNSRLETAGLDSTLRRQLAAYFGPYNEELFGWLGCRFEWSG
jgi:hypothetical protein